MIDKEIKILGYSVGEIRLIDQWLKQQNAKVEDLECCSLYWHKWAKERLFESMLRFNND